MDLFKTDLPPALIVLFVILSILQIIVKGVALWRSSQLKQRNWFIGLFILMPLNDLGIVSLFYLFRFSKKRLSFSEIKSWFKKN